LIQNELDEAERIQPSGSQPPPSGSGRPSVLEDPASWFSDADLKVSKSSSPRSRAQADRAAGAWLEGGLDEISKVSSPGAKIAAATLDDSGITDLGDELEPEDTVPDDEPPMTEPSSPRGPGLRSPVVATAGGSAVLQAQAAQSKSGTGKMVVITLVAMVAIAAVVLWIGLHRG
jgi:hypothetical protein